VVEPNLKALAHLAALRTNCRRAIIALMDANTQYIIAEAGPDSLDKTSAADDVGWLGSNSTRRSESVCQHMLRMDPGTPINAAPLCMVVPDLSKDSRFSDLFYVKSEPHARFYGAVSIRSNVGCIGTLIVMDESPRDGLSQDQIALLHNLSGLVMNQLDYMQMRENHRRGERMTKGLSMFVAGGWSINDAELPPDPGLMLRRTSSARRSSTSSDGSKGLENKESTPASTDDTDSIKSTASVTAKTPSSVASTPNSRPSGPTTSSSGRTSATDALSQPHSVSIGRIPDNAPPHDTDPAEPASSAIHFQQQQLPNSMKRLFGRACNILRECVDADGVIFYDASIGSFGGYNQTNADRQRWPSRRKPTRDPTIRVKKKKQLGVDSPANASDSGTEEGEPSRQSRRPVHRQRSSSSSAPEFPTSEEDNERKACAVLGLSRGANLEEEKPQDDQPVRRASFKETFLQSLIESYPNGKVFALILAEGSSSSESEDPLQALSPTISTTEQTLSDTDDGKGRRRQVRRQRQDASELAKLRRYFPEARSLIFCPLWDYQRERWFAAGFIWSTSPFRTFTITEDLNYFACFGNSIMSEVARIDAVTADLAKTSFISSMSHELRSPLHGILASAELLREAATSRFQLDMVSSIDRCGAILLDSINHVLDFTKINTFIKSKSKRKAQESTATMMMRGNSGSLETLKKEVDLARLMEETMEGVFAGHSHNDLFLKDDWLVSSAIDKDKRVNLPSSKKSVICILDIDWRLNWIFTTQPGAWTRIIVNLFSNALKYTDHGFVRVSLQATSSDVNDEDEDHPVTVNLTVSDSGRGISQEFLQSRLFKPFSQENNLSVGTGLGLSIVSQLVQAMDGKIDVQSERGYGTDFKISVSLVQPSNPNQSIKPEPTLLDQVRSKTTNLTLCLVGFSKLLDNVDTTDPIAMSQARCLLSVETSFSAMARDWFHMNVVTAGDMNQANGDVILIYEAEFLEGERQKKAGTLLSKPMIKTPGGPSGPPLIVLCQSRRTYEKYSREGKLSLGKEEHSNIELIPLP
jgi:signal transduction histidine kinase